MLEFMFGMARVNNVATFCAYVAYLYVISYVFIPYAL